MLSTILSKLVKVALVAMMGGTIAPNLGSTYPVSNIATSYVAGGGISSTATSVTLRSLKFSVSDQEIAMTDFGTIGYATIEPGSSTKKETISFTGISQSGSNDQATLSGVTRGLAGNYPYTASTTLASSHSGGSVVIFSNPAIFYGENFANKNNDESIYGDWTFQATSTPQYRTAPTFISGSNEFASVKLVEDTSNQGAATSTTATGGISELAERSEAGTVTGGSGYSLVLPAGIATTTREVATSSVMMSDALGYIAQTFFNFSTLWQFGSTTHSASSTFSADVLIGADLTVVGTTTIDALEIDGSIQGDILYYEGDAWKRLPTGTSGQVLQTGGAAANPSWIDAFGSVQSSIVATSTINNMTYTTSTPMYTWASTTDEQGTQTVTLIDDLIDGNIASASSYFDTIGDFIQIEFDKLTYLKKVRNYGNGANNADGTWTVQYFNESTNAWTDWITGLATVGSSAWGAYREGIPIATLKIRLVATAIDTGSTNKSLIYEFQMRYAKE